MSGCVIKDCTEDATHHIHNPSTGESAMICDTHVVHIPDYPPNPENTDEEE